MSREDITIAIEEVAQATSGAEVSIQRLNVAKKALQDALEAGPEHATKADQDTIQRLNAVHKALGDGLKAGAKKNYIPIMSFPAEIRRMILRNVLVKPHDGYLKLEQHWSGAVVCRMGQLELQLFQVSRQMNEECKDIMYNDNVFAITQQLQWRNISLASQRRTMRMPDVSRITKVHLTTHASAYHSSRTPKSSPRYYRKCARDYVMMFAEAFDYVNAIQVQYLLIDVLHGFGATTRQVRNLFRPLEGMTSIPNVHIVCTDKDHFPYLRYLETSMMGDTYAWDGPNKTIAQLTRWYENSVEDKSEQASKGNAIARVLGLEPCYTTSTSTTSTKTAPAGWVV